MRSGTARSSILIGSDLFSCEMPLLSHPSFDNPLRGNFLHFYHHPFGVRNVRASIIVCALRPLYQLTRHFPNGIGFARYSVRLEIRCPPKRNVPGPVQSICHLKDSFNFNEGSWLDRTSDMKLFVFLPSVSEDVQWTLSPNKATLKEHPTMTLSLTMRQLHRRQSTRCHSWYCSC